MAQDMKQLRNAPIGVFDSGVGGLTVAREIMRQIPNEKIVYFGDTARVPYGSKSKDTITRYSRPVSYTHLDVYKRQQRILPQRKRRSHRFRPESRLSL